MNLYAVVMMLLRYGMMNRVILYPLDERVGTTEFGIG